MMRPTIDQLIEYVRGGETDPRVKEMLRHDPDREAKLREARFICKMIGRQQAPESGKKADPKLQRPRSDALSAAFDAEATRADEAIPQQMEAPLRLVRSPGGEYQIPEIRNLVRDVIEPAPWLGTLTVRDREDELHLSFEKEDSKRRRPADEDGVVPLQFRTYQQEAVASADEYRRRRDAIRIEGDGYTLSLTDKLAPGRPLNLRFTEDGSDTPIEDLHVLFIPTSAPLFRAATNRKGVVKLPMGPKPGVLRIGHRQFEFLNIKRKE